VTFTAVWGSLSLDDVKLIFNAVYEEVAHWRRNLFLLPTGKAGKDFIDECTRLIHEWTNNSPLRDISIKALMVMPSLLLQKPSRTSKAKEHGELLQKRLIQWKDGDIDSLVREVRFIQSSLKQSRVDVSIDATILCWKEKLMML